jgi:shikimate kinase|tara:strand:+ start:1100 stop:1282 length:183 start_codon:yes stop_codon:yes gene_type:complete
MSLTYNDLVDIDGNIDNEINYHLNQYEFFRPENTKFREKEQKIFTKFADYIATKVSNKSA